MTAVALMWEAAAVAGRGEELLEWVSRQPLDGTPGPLRRETFAAPGDRALVITWWEGPYDAALPELPDPPADLLRRPVHRWRFLSRDVR